MNMNTLSTKAVNKFILNTLKRNGIPSSNYYNDVWSVDSSTSSTGFNRRMVHKVWGADISKLENVLAELKEVGLEGWELYSSRGGRTRNPHIGIKKYITETKVRKYNFK
tara:strand:+ start:4301 stop:4627 length:327 start_codon:yes stop_codon:yes gene_type:complete